MCTISAKSTQKCFSSLPTMVPAPHPHPTESLSCSQWSASIRAQHLLGEDWVTPRTNFSDTGDAEILDFSGFVTEQRGFPAGTRGKQLACNAGDATCEGSIPGWGDPPEAGMAAHSSALAWRIPGTEEPGGATVHRVAKSQTRLMPLCTQAHSGTEFSARRRVDLTLFGALKAFETSGLNVDTPLCSLSLGFSNLYIPSPASSRGSETTPGFKCTSPFVYIINL